MPTPLTDADKVLRNDTGKDIVTKLNNIATAIQTSGTTSLYVITDAFDSTATYDVGSYVIYNSSLYKCTTAVTVAGAFDPSDWETVQVMDEIPDNVAGAIAMTQAQWDAIVDKAAWRNAHKNSYLVITDAPNLNPTASDIEYSGAVTVKQAIDADRHELLWTNTTHTSDFSAQTITPDTKGYTHFIIFTKAFKNNTFLHGNYCILGETNQINNIGGTNGGYSGDLEIATRTVAIATNSFTFTQSATSTNGGATSLDSTHCIPYKIFGIK